MPLNKVNRYQYSPNILDSEVGLVTKTAQGEKGMVSAPDANGRYILKAGTLFTGDDFEGVVFEDYDLTDDAKYPVSVVVAGRVIYDNVSAEAQAKAEELAANGLYLVGAPAE